MRIHPLPLLALLASLLALVLVGLDVGATPWIILLSASSCLLALSVVALYLRLSHHRRPLEVPVEDLSLWVDAGEPAKELQKLSPAELSTVLMVLRADLGSIISNSELLHQRFPLILSKPELSDLTKFNLVSRAAELVGALKQGEACLLRPPSHQNLQELLPYLERSAGMAESLLRDLEGISLAKGGIGEAYLLPLRRALEKMVRDLKEMKSNTESYLRLFLPTPPPAGVPPS